MTDHLSEETLAQIRSRRLAPADVLTVYDHLEGCAVCREKMAGTPQLDNVFAAFGSELQAAAHEKTPHLRAEEIADYIDERLNDADREIADSHLSDCPPCRNEVQDLLAFKASLKSRRGVEKPSAQPASFWKKAAAFWHQSAWGMAIQTATLATVILFLFTTLFLKRQVADLQNRLGDLQQKNEALQKEVETLPELQSQIAELQLEQSPLTFDASETTEALNDNGKPVAVRQGALTGIAALTPEDEQLIKNVLLAQQVKKPALPKELMTRGEVLMGNDNTKSFPLFRPRGEIVEAQRPTLSWGALEGATGYVVTVYDADANPVAKSATLSTTQWVLSASLKRGAIYSWEVTASRKNEEIIAPAPPAPPARFKILEQETVEEISRARRLYHSHLALGTLYAQAGLLADAEREFQALLAANPNSRLARKLLRSVQLLRPQKR